MFIKIDEVFYNDTRMSDFAKAFSHMDEELLSVHGLRKLAAEGLYIRMMWRTMCFDLERGNPSLSAPDELSRFLYLDNTDALPTLLCLMTRSGLLREDGVISGWFEKIAAGLLAHRRAQEAYRKRQARIREYLADLKALRDNAARGLVSAAQQSAEMSAMRDQYIKDMEGLGHRGRVPYLDEPTPGGARQDVSYLDLAKRL